MTFAWTDRESRSELGERRFGVYRIATLEEALKRRGIGLDYCDLQSYVAGFLQC
jgi:hypothetical protein